MFCAPVFMAPLSSFFVVFLLGEFMKKTFLSVLCVLSLIGGCTKTEPTAQTPEETQTSSESAQTPSGPAQVSDPAEVSAPASSAPASPAADSEASFQNLIEKDFAEAMAKARALEETDPEAANRAYQVLTEDYPNRFEPYHRLALLFEKAGDDEAAIALYEEAMRKNPTDAAFFNDFGWYSYTQNELMNAEVLLRKANLLAPNTPKYMVNLAVVVAEQGRWDDAFALFMKVPDYNAAKSYLSIAGIQSRQAAAAKSPEEAEKKFQLAEETLKKSLALAPEDPAALELQKMLDERKK